MNNFLILLCSLISFPLWAQSSWEVVAPDYIKGIQLFNPVTQNESPFIKNDEYFILSFDDLNSTYDRYHYYIKHYDRNWQESDLFESEFVNGYFTDDFRNYRPSYNTLQNYVHYEIQFPNERMQPKVSGNYALFVYTTDKKKPLFSVRFSIFEELTIIGVQASVFSKDVLKPNQQVQVIAQASEGFNLNDNVARTSLSIIQNNDWNESLMDIKPQFTFNNQFQWNQTNLLFYGGNEYNWLDTKGMESRGLTTERIEQRDLYAAYLFPDIYEPEIYEYNPDVDGAFYIRRNDLGVERDPSTQADYIEVFFTLPAPELKGKKVYIVGAFNQYECSERNQMTYEPNGGYYWARIVLKQGYYNYKYISIDAEGNRNFTIDGNFWQTENLYSALLYYRDFRQNYDRLIGYGEQIFDP